MQIELKVTGRSRASKGENHKRERTESRKYYKIVAEFNVIRTVTFHRGGRRTLRDCGYLYYRTD